MLSILNCNYHYCNDRFFFLLYSISAFQQFIEGFLYINILSRRCFVLKNKEIKLSQYADDTTLILDGTRESLLDSMTKNQKLFG